MPRRPQSLAVKKRSHHGARLHCWCARPGHRTARPLRFEPLEGRHLLSATPANAAIQVFNAAPALFVENQGQWRDDAVHYRFGGSGLDISFTNEGLHYHLMEREATTDSDAGGEDVLTASSGRDFEPPAITRATQFSVSFAGANAVTPVGLDEAITKFNYFVGDQANWREGVSSFETIAYENLYDGIDLHTFGRRDSLKYEFYVAPGADWRQIQINYDGIDGLSIDESGALHIQTELGELLDTAPYIYQNINGQQIEVTGSFVLLDKDSYAFEIQGSYDPTVELVIDPYVQWSTYLGGTLDESAFDIAVDGNGNFLVAGRTKSSGWISGGYDTVYDNPVNTDAFALKISPTGQHLWSTYLGGTGSEVGEAITTNTAGEVFVTGESHVNSGGWLTPSLDNTPAGENDAFVVKLSSAGAYVWGTFVGGTNNESGSDIGVDSSGAVLIIGQTSSSNSSGWVINGADTSFNNPGEAEYDAFVAKLTSAGVKSWVTYLGGINDDVGQNIAVVSTGTLYVSGYTESDGWISGGYDSSFEGGQDAFVAKLASSNGAVTWSTYVGGDENSDNAYGIVADASGNAYVTGYTESVGWVSGGFDTTYNGDPFDGYVVKINSDGSHAWSTYLGGTFDDRGETIAINSNGEIYTTGFTKSSGWTVGGFDTSYNSPNVEDAYLVKLNSNGDHLWSSYLGGSSYDVGYGVATIGTTAVVVVGTTRSSSDWISGGFDSSFNGASNTYDGFVARISDTNPPVPALLGDYNRNNTVDAADYVLWRKTLGALNVVPYSSADGSGDGRIGQEDFDVWRAHYGHSIPAVGTASGSSDESAALASAESEALNVPAALSVRVAGAVFDLPLDAIVSRQIDAPVRESRRFFRDSSATDEALIDWLNEIQDMDRPGYESSSVPREGHTSVADEPIDDAFNLQYDALSEFDWRIDSSTSN